MTLLNTRTLCAALCGLVISSGCGPEEPPPGGLSLKSLIQELPSDNGQTLNGLSANGLSANGLSANGLSANGLSKTAFSAWFQQDPSTADMVMRYLVRCAVPKGQSRSYTHPTTGQHYTWYGNLGLTPRWASGQPAKKIEQEIITACLLGHVNQSGHQVTISVLGRNAQGQIIPYTQQELALYSVREACFFGNLFTQRGLFFGVDRWVSSSEDMLLTRACSSAGTQGTGGASQACAPLQFVGSCWRRCQMDLQAGAAYRRCFHNGQSYRALTTRMREQDFEKLFPNEME